MITIKAQIIIAIFIVIALYIIVNMIGKRQLELKYALAWLLVGVGILVLDLFPNLMIGISNLLGIVQPINMLFFVGFCFALCIIFGLTVAISKMSVRIKELAQEIAIYKKQNEDEHNIKMDKKNNENGNL